MRVLLPVFAVLLAVCGCGLYPLAGGSTDTGNPRVVAKVYKQDGTAASGARVTVTPATFLKSFALSKSAASSTVEGVTDSSGCFSVGSLPVGDYCIEVNDRNLAGAVLFRIAIKPGETSRMVLCDTLRPYGSIEGSVDRRLSGYAYAQVYGLNRCVAVNQSGIFSLHDLPPGVFNLHIASTDTSFVPVKIENVACSTGTVMQLPLASWSHSREIVLNTSGSGANVGSAVTAFPVLIRLDNGNFDFSQALSNGGDIRFVKADMTPLEHEIERWDAAAGYAEVWVRVDTIFGNNSTQFIRMHWGNPGAGNQSNSAEVFDTTNGFRGVWHLGEQSGTVDDATRNHYNGSRIGNQSRADGQIGFGQVYTDSVDYSDMGNVFNPGTSDFTVSAWFKRTGPGPTNTIIGKTLGDTLFEDNYGWLLAIQLDYPRFYVASSGTRFGETGTFYCESSIRITDRSSWHFICAVADRSQNSGCRLYIDGVDVTKARVGDITRVGALSNAYPMRIGVEADNNYPLRGGVDEAVVSCAVRSADWVKLCYMNQRTENTLVEFRPMMANR